MKTFVKSEFGLKFFASLLVIFVWLTVIFDPFHITYKDKFIVGEGQEVICKNIASFNSGESVTLEVGVDISTDQKTWGWRVSNDKNVVFKDTAFISRGVVYYIGANPLKYYVKAVKK